MRGIMGVAYGVAKEYGITFDLMETGKCSPEQNEVLEPLFLKSLKDDPDLERWEAFLRQKAQFLVENGRISPNEARENRVYGSDQGQTSDKSAITK